MDTLPAWWPETAACATGSAIPTASWNTKTACRIKIVNRRCTQAVYSRDSADQEITSSPVREATALHCGEDWFVGFSSACVLKRSVEMPRPAWHLLVSIAITGRMQSSDKSSPEGLSLSSSLNVQLTDALRKYVDERASDSDVYATPSEYIRDLIRQDMQDRAIALNVLEGLDDLKHGRFSSKSIRDFKDED